MPVLGDTRVMPQTLERELRGGCEGAFELSRDDRLARRDLQGLRRPRPLRRARSTATSPTLIGRAFARVLARPARQAAGRAAGRARPRHAPAPRRSWPRRSRDGLVAEGAHVLDAGHGRHRDALLRSSARASSTAARWSPPRTTRRPTPGVKLVREGALALSGDAGIQRRPRATIEAGLGRAAGRRLGRGGRHLRRLPARTRSSFIDPATIRPLKVVVDGGNGMAGPMVGPLLDAPRPRAGRRPTGSPTASSPTTSRTRCCQENRQLHHRARCATRAPTSAIAWDGDADRCFFIDDDGEFVDGDFLTALLAEPLLAQGARRRRSSTTCAPAARCPTRSRRAGGTRAREPRRPRLLQDPRCARRARAFGGEVSGHYYFRDFYYADSGTIPALLSSSCSRSRASRCRELLERVPRALLHLRRDQLRGRRPGGEDAARSPSATPTARSRWLDGVSVDYADWHFNVRPSNTEPLLRLNLESLVSPRGHGAPSATRCWR